MQNKETTMDDTENPENGLETTIEEGNEEEKDLGASWNEEIEEDVLERTVAEQLRDSMVNDRKDLEAVFEVPVQVSAVLGRANMPVHQLLKLGRGAVIELDRRIGEAIDIYVNNLLVARGEVVVVEDRLGITMTEIIKSTGKI
jgi:flagellar motor switch protein FliN/FliY